MIYGLVQYKLLQNIILDKNLLEFTYYAKIEVKYTFIYL